MRRNNPPINRDPLLTDYFFEIPPVINKTTLEFEIPSDKKTIADFFNTKSEQFHQGVRALVEDLRGLAKEQKLYDKDVPTLAQFLKNCTYNPANKSEYYLDRVYPLLTQAVSDLAEIINVLKAETVWSEQLKDLFKELMRKLNTEQLCEPEMEFEIRDFRLYLSLDIKTIFMSIRQQLVKNVGSEVVNQHNIEIRGDTEIKFGSDSHYVRQMIKEYHKQLGIEKSKDVLAKGELSTPEMFRDFAEGMSKSLTATYMLEQLIERFKEQLEKIQFADDEQMRLWLMQFGNDDQFVFSLIGQFNDKNERYEFKQPLDLYLLHTLFKRLAAKGFFNEDEIKKHTLDDLPGVSMHIPANGNIKLAYVSFDKYRTPNEPLLIYYVQEFFADLADKTKKRNISLQIQEKLPPSQRKKLHKAVIELLTQSSPLKIDVLTKLLAVFHTHELRMFLFQALLAAGVHANTLAKGWYAALSVKGYNDKVMDLLIAHPEHAIGCAELMKFLDEDMGVTIDQSVLDLLESHYVQTDTMFDWLKQDDNLDQFLSLVDDEVLSFDNMNDLLEHVQHIDKVIEVLTELSAANNHKLDQEIVKVVIQSNGEERTPVATTTSSNLPEKDTKTGARPSYPSMFDASSSKVTDGDEPSTHPIPPPFDV